jgi:Holliday junction resolvase
MPEGRGFRPRKKGVISLAQSNYRRGVDVERKAMKTLEQAGYMVARTAGSHGPFDVIAIGPLGVRLIQLKRVKDGRYIGLDVAREQLRRIYEYTQAIDVSAELWVWQDGQGWILQEIIREGD